MSQTQQVPKTASGLPEYVQEILRDSEVQRLLTYVQRVVAVYFKVYTSNTIMEYEVFLQFCRDFGIFPDLCNKATLHDTFYALSFTNTRVAIGLDVSAGTAEYD